MFHLSKRIAKLAFTPKTFRPLIRFTQYRNIENNQQKNEKKEFTLQTVEEVTEKLKTFFNTLKINLPDERSMLGVVDIQARLGGKYLYIGRNVLHLCVADYLYTHFENLTYEQSRAVLFQFCNMSNLATVAKALNVHSLISMDADPERYEFESYLCQTIIRLVGAIYLHNGLYEARRFVVSYILQKHVDVEEILESFDPKAELRELLKSGAMKRHAGKAPVYVKQEKDGVFQCSIVCGDEVLGIGKGQTLRLAENRAAQNALNRHYAKFFDRFTPIQLEEMATQGTDPTSSA